MKMNQPAGDMELLPGFLPGAGKPGPVLLHLPHYGQLHLLPGHQEVLNLRDQGGKRLSAGEEEEEGQSFKQKEKPEEKSRVS